MAARWSVELIGEGIKKFQSEYGRMPSAHDFDDCPYLPSARAIQKTFGGLKNLRSVLGYEITDFTKGDSRKDAIKMINERGKQDEIKAYDVLKAKFGEMFVHMEKEYGFRNRVDFFVYHNAGYFGVDTFFPNNQKGFVNVLNLKLKKYVKFKGLVYFVVTNPEITRTIMTEHISKRKIEIPSNIVLVTFDEFLSELAKYQPIELKVSP